MPVQTTSNEYASADTMIIDEAGIDLQIDGETELGASFENLDSFQLAYAVLPTDYEPNLEGYLRAEEDMAYNHLSEEQLEDTIWAFSQALAKKRGYKRP